MFPENNAWTLQLPVLLPQMITFAPMNKIFQKRSKILVTCAKRISPYLRDEIQQLGYSIDEEWSTGVAITGTLRDCMRLNMNIRTGNQVMFLLETFKCTNADELYRHLYTMAWEDLIEVDGYLCVTSNVNNPSIDNTMFANVRVKDAIVDRIKEKKGARPNSGSDRNRTVIHLYWQEDEASVYIDTTGETLVKHNYRKLPGKAPMQEGLAAATIMASRWDRRSNFVNPMCGSGTLAIEAALLATNRVPGLLRNNYGFMHIKGYDEAVYEAEFRSIEEKVNDQVDFRIVATDNDPRVMEAARVNADIAGVAGMIEFKECDFLETDVPQDKGGVVMFNPEYGERLGEYEALELVYKSLGDFMKQKCKGYFGYILTASPNLAKKVGLKATRKLEFYNSKLDCRLLEYELYGGTRRTDFGPPAGDQH